MNNLSLIELKLLERLDGLPARLSIACAAPILGTSAKAIYSQIGRGRGLFARIVRGEEGEEKWIALGDIAKILLGHPLEETKMVAKVRKAGRLSNQEKAASQQGGANV